MADRLYLSCWVRGFTEQNMLRHWEKMLRRFPFSRLRPRAELRIHGIELSEPPLLERDFVGEGFIDGVLAAAAEYRHADCAYVLDAAWDIWQFESDWKLAPADVVLSCHGPDFASDQGEHLSIEFGPDAPFLPAAAHGDQIAPVRHNIRSLLYLVKDLEDALALDKRRLWSESGENLAARLQATLAER